MPGNMGGRWFSGATFFCKALTMAFSLWTLCSTEGLCCQICLFQTFTGYSMGNSERKVRMVQAGRPVQLVKHYRHQDSAGLK